jgi:predicted Ser/Thr protein kinase
MKRPASSLYFIVVNLSKTLTVVALFLTGCLLSSPAVAKISCANVFGDLHPRLSELDPKVHAWLANRQKTLPTTIDRRSAITVNGNEYPVAAVLGQGSEGTVFLVRTSQGFAAAKVFQQKGKEPDKIRDGIMMEGNVEVLRNVGKMLNVPKIYSVDRERNIVLMEYIEGIPVLEIRDKYKEIGLTAAEASDIRAKFLDSEYSSKFHVNVVYSIKEQKFYLIDPF